MTTWEILGMKKCKSEDFLCALSNQQLLLKLGQVVLVHTTAAWVAQKNGEQLNQKRATAAVAAAAAAVTPTTTTATQYKSSQTAAIQN